MSRSRCLLLLAILLLGVGLGRYWPADQSSQVIQPVVTNDNPWAESWAIDFATGVVNQADNPAVPSHWQTVSEQRPIELAQVPQPPVLPRPVVPMQPGVNRPVPWVVPGNGQAALPPELSPEEEANIRVYEQTNGSVVNISTKVVNQQGALFGDAFQEGAGSGSLIDQAGHILTNFHVIENAREIDVTLANGKTFDATVIGTDPPNDMAVIKIQAPADLLKPIPFGDSTSLRVGQRVLAIGNPFGLERTLTTGIVSSLNRSLPTRSGRTIKSIIQIDAAINPGNSGGPLLDSRGRIIGMNTAIASKTGQNTGVGFAIPINTIARVVPQLIQNGKVIRPETGITRVFPTEQGLLIATLAEKGPGAMAGLRGIQVIREKKQRGPFVYETERLDRSKADLIVGVNGKPIKTADDFLTTVETFRPGDEIQLNIVRENQPAVVKLKLSGGE